MPSRLHDHLSATSVQRSVRLSVALLIAALASGPVIDAWDARDARDAGAQQGTDGAPLNLPVSIVRIRAALERSPTERLRIVLPKPDFRVTIQERQRVEELLATLNFNSGPVPPGGLYAFDQKSRLSSPWGAQPIVSVDMLAIGRSVANGISYARRAHGEAAAREELGRAIAEYCAAQSNRGAGIQICASSPAIR